MPGHLQAWLLKAWMRRGIAAWMLRPVSWVFRGLLAARRALYRAGWLAAPALPVPVIVVGNVMVGGVGKTPLVITLVQQLQSAGFQVGVVSRGYGRSTTACVEVSPSSRPGDVGDEALLTRRKTGAPLFVARNRPDAVLALLAAYPATQVIVSDDGLQHLALQRDIELCAFDDRGVGNGWLMPAGPLREPWPRRQCALPGRTRPLQFTVHTGEHPAFDGYQAHRRLADFALRADGSQVALDTLATDRSLTLVALAGIAQPEVFFQQLRARGLQLAETVALTDHYDFHSWKANKDNARQLICTEKDAVKLWHIDPQALAVPLAVTLDPQMMRQLIQCLRAKLSSTP